MLALTLVKDDWVLIGTTRVKVDCNCKITLDAPANIIVLRSKFVAPLLAAEVERVLSSKTELLDVQAVHYLCEQFGLYRLVALVGNPGFTKNNPMIEVLLTKILKRPT